MVQKIRRDQSMCLVIAPIWPTESWYTDLLQILIDNPIILPTQRTLLTIKSTNKVHPLWDKMRLMASGFHDAYVGNCVFNLEANKSKFGTTNFSVTILKTFEFSFHSLFSLHFLLSMSATL
jgi:hypothetical protein